MLTALHALQGYRRNRAPLLQTLAEGPLPPHHDDPARADLTVQLLVALASAAFVHIHRSHAARQDTGLVEAVRLANAHIDGLYHP